MKKIKICEEDASLRELLSLCLQLKDYRAEKVTDINASNCSCPSDGACASALIVSAKCPDSCKALMDKQEKNGCKIPKQNKVILSSEFAEGQRGEIEKTGYSTIEKPYKFSTISEWLDSIELRTQDSANNDEAIHEEYLNGFMKGVVEC